MSLLQSEKPALHAPVQLPLEHAGVAMLFEEQALPQAPQLATSVASGRSQPSPETPLQSPKPALHAPMPHAPVLHAGTPLATAGHGVPQALQLFTSLSRSASQPSPASALQSPKCRLQEGTQAPAAQPASPLATAGHARPQRLQFAGSTAVCTSQPLATCESQSAKPALQAPMAQALPTHAAVEFAAVHAVVQLPQCWGSNRQIVWGAGPTPTCERFPPPAQPA